MYDDITSFYQHIFPLNQFFLQFIPAYIKKTPSKILDLGCGPGDYVNEFSRQGHQATGIDSSEPMIVWAKQHHQGNFHHLSFTEINKLKRHFDCMYCIGNSLSYLPHESTAGFLQDVFNLLNSDGSFILQFVNWDKYRLSGSMEFPIQHLTDGRSFLRSYEAHPGSTVLFRTEIQKDGQTLQTWADHLYPRYADVFPDEITKSGLTITGVYGDFKQNPFDATNSPALVITARKN
jgi:2-polyprenyl-3-methyl-5-hydroxy-6-metoxy-1,4-benzoquinol methylase